jgi:phage protein U
MAFDPIPLFKKEVFARLGDFSFELLTLSPEKVERETGYRWVKLEPIGAPAIHQYIGPMGKIAAPAEDKLIIAGVLHPEFSGRIDHLKKLRDMAATGKPLRLIYADTQIGQNMGLWIIQKIKESRSIFYGDGIPRRIEFSLELEFYG